MVAEAELGEAAYLDVTLGQGGKFFQQPFDKPLMAVVDQFDEVVPIRILKVELDGGCRDHFRKGLSGKIHLILQEGQIHLVLSHLFFQTVFQVPLPQQLEHQDQIGQQHTDNQQEHLFFYHCLSI